MYTVFGKMAGLAACGPSTSSGRAKFSMLSMGPTPVPKITPTRLRFSSFSSRLASRRTMWAATTEKMPSLSMRRRSLGFRNGEGSRSTRPMRRPFSSFVASRFSANAFHRASASEPALVRVAMPVTTTRS